MRIQIINLYIRKEIDNMKGFVDKNTCIGCGLCPSICEDIFYMDDDGLANAFDVEIADHVVASAKEAAESCPTASITVE
ncbi:MAG: fer [Haloplasmataceae bacterium]|jgi:ferredoxin|nr:fer [Haloplasmataceae bacterium]